MTIIGFKKGANSISAIVSVRNHTGMSLAESKRLIERVLAGNPVTLDDDFVLREELTEQKFIVQ
jgi:ribosomal protein L7/L12